MEAFVAPESTLSTQQSSIHFKHATSPFSLIVFFFFLIAMKLVSIFEDVFLFKKKKKFQYFMLIVFVIIKISCNEYVQLLACEIVSYIVQVDFFFFWIVWSIMCL